MAIPTPARAASAAKNSAKQTHKKKLAVADDPLGEFAAEVSDQMAAVSADLSSRKLKSWNDAKLREQTRGLIISNVQATEAARVARRQLLTRDHVAERDIKRDSLILDRLQEFVDYAVQLVPLDRQAIARKEASDFLYELRGRIAADLETVK